MPWVTTRAGRPASTLPASPRPATPKTHSVSPDQADRRPESWGRVSFSGFIDGQWAALIRCCPAPAAGAGSPGAICRSSSVLSRPCGSVTAASRAGASGTGPTPCCWPRPMPPGKSTGPCRRTRRSTGPTGTARTFPAAPGDPPNGKKRRTEPGDHAVGRSRGGLSTKIPSCPAILRDRGPDRELAGQGVPDLRHGEGAHAPGPGLYLPQVWTDDRARCAGAGVPQTRKFATKPRAGHHEHPRPGRRPTARWVTGDAVYGQRYRLRKTLEDRSVYCVLAVPVNQHGIAKIAPIGTEFRADQLMASRPKAGYWPGVPWPTWKTRRSGRPWTPRRRVG